MAGSAQRASKKRVRHIGFMIQPLIMVDDGENLEGLALDPVEVKAVDWPDWPKKFAADLKQLEEELNA